MLCETHENENDVNIHHESVGNNNETCLPENAAENAESDRDLASDHPSKSADIDEGNVGDSKPLLSSDAKSTSEKSAHVGKTDWRP